MDQITLDKLRYPTGKLQVPSEYNQTTRQDCIEKLKSFPTQLASTIKGLDDTQLDLPYRTDGWSARQIVHHLADSHMNAFIRFKLALTEDNPHIKGYDEAAWADGPDATLPVTASISIIHGIHERLSYLMSKMSPSDYSRTLYHPEHKKNLTLDHMAALYTWHGNHHRTQIAELRERQGWNT